MRELPLLMNDNQIRAILDKRKKIVLHRTYCRRNEDCNSNKHLWRRLVNSCVENSDSGCWIWLRHINNQGYGKLTINGRGIYAHRLAFKLYTHKKLGGMQVCHKCDNPRCINPRHLFLCTQSDNMRDCYKKGRSKPPVVSFKGENNPAAKLKMEQVNKIKRRLLLGETQQSIADDFGISQPTVSDISRGVCWQ